MFSLPRLVEFNRNVGTYWLKDDHDTLDNDSWPGRKAGEFTFAEGQRTFRQQAPMTDGPSYRTFRWGRDLQVWLTDGGDEVRGWLREHVPDNFFVVCGDRHWQYHSAHPKTGLNEFSVGARPAPGTPAARPARTGTTTASTASGAGSCPSR